MKKAFLMVLLASGLLPLFGQLPASPVKQQELTANGRSTWTPGQTRGQGQRVKPIAREIVADSGVARDTQTMIYDNGVLNALPTTFGLVYGNRFDLGIGGVALGAITLNSFSFYFMEDSLPDTGLFIQPSDPINASMFSARLTINIPGLVNSGPGFTSPMINIINQSALGTTGMFNNTFYLGGWCVNSATTLPVDNEAIGLNVGFRASNYKGYTASSGTGSLGFAMGSFQAIMRANVTSAQLVPVELMSFSLEEK